MLIDELFLDYKVNHLRFSNEANFNDANIMNNLKSAISSVSNIINRSIVITNVSSFVEFNAGIANFNPIPNEGLVYINNNEYFTDEYGELQLKYRHNGRFRCNWVSGFDCIDRVPSDIKEAIYKLASHLFHYRGDAMNRTMIGGSSRSIENINNPLVDSGAMALLAPYVRYAC